MKHLFSLVLGLALVALPAMTFLPGCGGGGSGPTANPTSTPLPGATATTVPTTTTATIAPTATVAPTSTVAPTAIPSGGAVNLMTSSNRSNFDVNTFPATNGTGTARTQTNGVRTYTLSASTLASTNTAPSFARPSTATIFLSKPSAIAIGDKFSLGGSNSNAATTAFYVVSAQKPLNDSRNDPHYADFIAFDSPSYTGPHTGQIVVTGMSANSISLRLTGVYLENSGDTVKQSQYAGFGHTASYGTNVAFGSFLWGGTFVARNITTQ